MVSLTVITVLALVFAVRKVVLLAKASLAPARTPIGAATR